MMRLWSAVFIAVLLAACSGPNTGLNTLQISSEALPFPENYQTEAARVVRDRGGDSAVARVSYPRQTIGAGLLSPRRWYACVSGLPDPVNRSETIPPVLDLVEHWISQRVTSSYYVVLIFSGDARRPSVKAGLDSPLCRDAAYGPIIAEPPLT